ncbi:MAG: S8 family serine peptidase [bacterium]
MPFLRRYLIFIALLVTASYPTASAVTGYNGPSGPVPGRFVVKLKAGIRPHQLPKSLGQGNTLQRASALTVKQSLPGAEQWQRLHVFVSDDKSLSASDVSRLIGPDKIEYIEPEYWLEFFAMPQDEYFPDQWYLRNVGQEYLGILRVYGYYNDQLITKSGDPGDDINVDPFYTSPPAETTAVVVAIVDSGADLLHPELIGRFWRNPDEIAGNGIDDDHNGFVDDTLGYDVSGDSLSFFDPIGDNDPTDEHGHGTHLAGIVAANANTAGVIGIAPHAMIMPIKIRPNATTAVGAAGIFYAVNAGAQVINISWGTPFQSAILREAVNFARTNGVLVTVAPGNTGDNTRYYPAAYDSVFVVAAGNSRGYETDFSTYGAHVDIVAPGLDILSLRAVGTDMYEEAGEPGVRIIGQDSLYYLSDGTSMAAPVAAGAAALLLSFRPDLTLPELEEILLLGADDLIDPRNQGDSLPGPDTLSGYGYINVQASLNLLQEGGLHLVSPVSKRRYTDDVVIKAAASAGYTGSWLLEYAVGPDALDYIYLAAGNSLPPDSILAVFDDTEAEGLIKFRITDKFGSQSTVTCRYVRARKLEITSPQGDSEARYNIPIIGNAYGPDFDSVAVRYRKAGQSVRDLMSSTGEYYDSLLCHWSVSGSDTGQFTIYVFGYFNAGDELVDSVQVDVRSAFAVGWPQKLAGLTPITPVCDDLDKDGQRELIVTSSNGLYVFDAYGNIRGGFPALPQKNVRCVPALYDVDRDGEDEIIFTDEDGIHVVNHDGTYAQGWPQACVTGRIPYGYGFPNPTVTRLGMDEDSAIVIINRDGNILAYEFSGDSYFFSMEGLFATFDPRISDSYWHGGFTSPFVTGADVTGDGVNEVIAMYSAPEPHTGLAIFDGRTGQPAFDREEALVQMCVDVHGSALADLNGDLVPEIIMMGKGGGGVPTIWVKTNGLDDLDGWPIFLNDVQGWIGSYPIVADLDLDGSPEILCTYFEYDIASLFAFRADGSPYVSHSGRPSGELFHQSATFGTPMVANLTGDAFPEIIVRSGYVLPSTGDELIHILDYEGNPIPGWPVPTPARPSEVFSSRYAPLVDDLDGDGLLELIMVGDGSYVMAWDFDAAYENGDNNTRFLADNINSGHWQGFDGSPTSVEPVDGVSLPTEFALDQNYPNPFNPSTVIEFELSRRSHVTLEILNILGQSVATLVNEIRPAGRHQVNWAPTQIASGVYFYRLKTDDQTVTRKMALIR